MAELVDVHEALAETLRQNLGRNDLNYFAFPAPVVTDSKIEVWPAEGSYLSYNGLIGPQDDADLLVRLRLFAQVGDDTTAGRLIAELLSPDGVIAAVMANPTLGGVVASVAPGDDVTWDIDTELYAHVAWIPLKIRLTC